MTTRILMGDAGPGDAFIVYIDDTPAAPWVAVVDGGPPGTASRTLLPLLAMLERNRFAALSIDLLAVTHIDSDHIGGILEIVQQRLTSGPFSRPIQCAWHNSFEAITNDQRLVQDKMLRQRVLTASASLPDPDPTRAIVASVAQGQNLAALLRRAGLSGNAPFNGLLVSGDRAEWPGGPAITIVGPTDAELERLRRRWSAAINQQPNAELAARTASATIDNSVTNLASLVFLLDHDGHRVLFTGDARGDRVVTQLQTLGLLNRFGRIVVDALKVPHHGSERSCTPDLFDTVQADHYLISGNGHHGNPSPITTQRLAQSLRGRPANVWFTHQVDDAIAVLNPYPNIKCWIPGKGAIGVDVVL